MLKFMKKVLLKREALLFDSPLFIIKSFAAIMIGYVLFAKNSLLGKDMISLLFGIMLTLEPVNMKGLKNGMEQIMASVIGGSVTAVIVIVGGINFITVPLAVAVTLYITLRINWRTMSIIAVFTSIYMTQYIQYTSAGEPSMFLTLQLRLLALGTGIFIALILNFVFSFVFYRSMLRKRTIFVVEQTVSYMKTFMETKENFMELKKDIYPIFGDIDYISGHIADIKRKKGNTEVYAGILMELREINHCFLDLIMVFSSGETELKLNGEVEKIVESLESIKEGIVKKETIENVIKESKSDDKNVLRINASINKISIWMNNKGEL